MWISIWRRRYLIRNTWVEKLQSSDKCEIFCRNMALGQAPGSEKQVELITVESILFQMHLWIVFGETYCIFLVVPWKFSQLWEFYSMLYLVSQLLSKEVIQWHICTDTLCSKHQSQSSTVFSLQSHLIPGSIFFVYLMHRPFFFLFSYLGRW